MGVGPVGPSPLAREGWGQQPTLGQEWQGPTGGARDDAFAPLCITTRPTHQPTNTVTDHLCNLGLREPLPQLGHDAPQLLHLEGRSITQS